LTWKDTLKKQEGLGLFVVLNIFALYDFLVIALSSGEFLVYHGRDKHQEGPFLKVSYNPINSCTLSGDTIYMVDSNDTTISKITANKKAVRVSEIPG
jgi:hypothetical protein